MSRHCVCTKFTTVQYNCPFEKLERAIVVVCNYCCSILPGTIRHTTPQHAERVNTEQSRWREGASGCWGEVGRVVARPGGKAVQRHAHVDLQHILHRQRDRSTHILCKIQTDVVNPCRHTHTEGVHAPKRPVVRGSAWHIVRISMPKCASWVCSAAMAFNVTASLFSGYMYAYVCTWAWVCGMCISHASVGSLSCVQLWKQCMVSEVDRPHVQYLIWYNPIDLCRFTSSSYTSECFAHSGNSGCTSNESQLLFGNTRCA